MIGYETTENASRGDAYAEPKALQRTSRYQYLTDTNPDTRAGKLLRQYWQPVALTTDLPPGGPPLGIRIMGQDVVLFRDDADRVGALDRKCIHRCADLVLGRIENGGLRCPYHGWLFNTDGQVLDQPAEASPTANIGCTHPPTRSTKPQAHSGSIWARDNHHCSLRIRRFRARTSIATPASGSATAIGSRRATVTSIRCTPPIYTKWNGRTRR